MQHKTLKLSTLAVLIAGATQANAAVYKVVEVDPSGNAESEILQLGYESKDLTGRVETYGQAIEPSAQGVNCFDSNSSAECTERSFKVVGESRVGTDGINYRDEVAFSYDNYQEINDYSGFRTYCYNNLGFNTCEDWANRQYYGLSYNQDDSDDGSGYGGLHREHIAWDKDYYASAQPLVEKDTLLERHKTFSSDSSKYDKEAVAQLGSIVSGHETSDGVVSGIGTLASDSYTLGVSSGAYFYNGSRYARQFNKRGFVNLELADKQFVLNPPATNTLVEKMGQTLAWDAVEYEYDDAGTKTKKLLVVGSASYEKSKLDDDNKLPDDLSLGKSELNSCSTASVAGLFSTRECQHAVFANDAYFWTVDANGRSDALLIANRGNLQATDPDARERSFQASARAVAMVKDVPVVAGYSTQYVDNDFYAITATVFTPKFGSGESPNAEGWERKQIPGLSIKQSGDRKYRYTIATDINENNLVVGVGKNYSVNNRSYAESMFVFNNNTDQLKMLDTSVDANIFFSGSNGYPAAINNHDQLVGWVDAEMVNQVDGRQRRQRAFTYMAGGDIDNSPLKAKKAWMIDDLTYGGEFSSANNKFRIAQASGINDAGVISATAFKCEGGYQDATKESKCSSDERVVAVKLIPIADGTLESRPADEANVSRSGASLGLFALTLLGFIGFRRRK